MTGALGHKPTGKHDGCVKVRDKLAKQFGINVGYDLLEKIWKDAPIRIAAFGFGWEKTSDFLNQVYPTKHF